MSSISTLYDKKNSPIYTKYIQGGFFIYSMFETNLMYPTLSIPDSEIAGAKINLPVGTPEWKFSLILILILNFYVLLKKSKVLIIVL